jgi:hypothetical protein
VRLAERAQGRLHLVVLARAQQHGSVARQELSNIGRVTAAAGVGGGGGERTSCLVPARGDDPQRPGRVGVLALQVRLEVGPQQRVDPVLLVAPAEPGDERGGALNPAQDVDGVGAPGQRDCERRRQRVADAHPAQDVADVCGQPVEHLAGEVVGERAVRDVELVEESSYLVRVPPVTQSDCDETQSCGPPLGAGEHHRDLLGLDVKAGIAQELRGLGRTETQMIGPDLRQLALGTEPRDVQGRIAARRQHQSQAARSVADQAGDRAQRCGCGQQVHVVEDQDERARQRVERVDHLGEQVQLAQPPARPVRSLPTRCVAGVEGCEDRRPERARVVVVGRQRDPGHGPDHGTLAVHATRPGRQQHGLAVASRGTQKRDGAPDAGVEQTQQPLSVDRRRHRCGRAHPRLGHLCPHRCSPPGGCTSQPRGTRVRGEREDLQQLFMTPTPAPHLQLDRVDLSAVASLIGESASPPVTRGARAPHHLQVMPPPYVVMDTRPLTDVIAEQGRSGDHGAPGRPGSGMGRPCWSGRSWPRCRSSRCRRSSCCASARPSSRRAGSWAGSRWACACRSSGSA